MKATGIVRKIDELGRIVIPKELRNILEINVKDAVEIFTEDDHIILRKYSPACIFCGSMDDIQNIKGKNICRACIREISEK